MNDYQPQLEKAIAAVKVLQVANPESEEFSDALAESHVCSTVLEPHSEGVREAIDPVQQLQVLAQGEGV